MFALLKRGRNLSLPMDIKFKLFNVLVMPVVLYGLKYGAAKNVPYLKDSSLDFFNMCYL